MLAPMDLTAGTEGAFSMTSSAKDSYVESKSNKMHMITIFNETALTGRLDGDDFVGFLRRKVSREDKELDGAAGSTGAGGAAGTGGNGGNAGAGGVGGTRDEDSERLPEEDVLAKLRFEKQ